MAEKLDKADWRNAAFMEVLKRTPPAVRMFDDRAICPWCGFLHETITIGSNLCEECRRGFVFGYPPWGVEDGRPISWVFMSWEEQNLAVENLNLFPPFEPNERLRDIYRVWRDFDKDNDDSPTSETLH